MNSRRDTVYYLIFCFLVLIVFSINSFSQPHTDLPNWYTKGKQAFEGETGFGGAKGWLEFAKQTLSENITVGILEDVLEQGAIPLNEFFDKLLERDEQITEIINDLRDICADVKNRLKIAKESFEKEVNKSDSKYKTEAYLKLIDTYLVMNREKEVVDLYEEFQKSKFESTSLPIDEVKNIFHQVATVYFKGNVKSENISSIENPGAMVIRKYMEFAEGYFEKQLQDQNKDSDSIKSIESKLIMSKFDLAEFYIETRQLAKAREEYQNRKREVEENSDRYPTTKDEIIALGSNIDKVTDVHFTFTKQSFLAGAKVHFFPTESGLSSKELLKHCNVVIYLPGEGEESIVKLENEITLSQEKNKICVIPSGNYKIVIKIPKLSIKDENRIPFRIKLIGPGVEEYIVTAPSEQRNTELILNNSTPILCDKDTFTEHNILKDYQVPIGNYNAKIQSNIYLLPGQKYNLSFEPASPIPSQRPWWIITAAIASGISALTYFLQR